MTERKYFTADVPKPANIIEKQMTVGHLPVSPSNSAPVQPPTSQPTPQGSSQKK